MIQQGHNETKETEDQQWRIQMISRTHQVHSRKLDQGAYSAK